MYRYLYLWAIHIWIISESYQIIISLLIFLRFFNFSNYYFFIFKHELYFIFIKIKQFIDKYLSIKFVNYDRVPVNLILRRQTDNHYLVLVAVRTVSFHMDGAAEVRRLVFVAQSAERKARGSLQYDIASRHHHGLSKWVLRPPFAAG